MKKCGTCKRSKSTSLFHKSTKRGWQSRCKSCVKKYDRKRYPGYRKRKNGLSRERRQLVRDWFANLKRKPCTDCGGVFDPVCMDWDHVIGDKAFDIGDGVTRKPKQLVLSEIAKCELVCSNCHRLRTKARLLHP